MGEKEHRHRDSHEQDLDAASAASGEQEASKDEKGKEGAGAGYLAQPAVETGTTDVTGFKDPAAQSYAHGAFMGAAGAFMKDPLWNQIFAAVWPEEHARVSAIEDIRALMLQLENNPVLSAYGECQSMSKAGQEKGAADPAKKAGVVGQEWDIFLDKEDPGNLSKCKIAHGTMGTTILQNLPGLKDTAIGYGRKDVKNAKHGGEWLEIFGKAVAMYRGGAADPAAAEAQPAGQTERMQAALAATTAGEAVEIAIDFMRKENGGGLILDVKSTYSTPADIQIFVDVLQAKGINVMGVGTFRHTQLEGLEEGVRPVKFFHAITGLANAGASGALKSADHVMFNAGSLLTKATSGWFGRGEASYTVNEGALQTLSDLVSQFQLNVGLYVQEGDIDEKAVDVIMKLVNRSPHLFKDGFAYGNVSGKAETETEGTGMGSQGKADAMDKAAATPRTIGEKVQSAWDGLW